MVGAMNGGGRTNMTRAKRVGVVVGCVMAMVGAAPGQVQRLWSVPWSNWAQIESHVWVSPAANIEAADDFDVTGTVTKVIANGTSCFGCPSTNLLGVWVRFYQWAGGTPGLLQSEVYVPMGSPNLAVSATSLGTIEVTLPTPFVAAGRHFVSVQGHFTPSGLWGIWTASLNAPALSPMVRRDNLGAGTWGPYIGIVGGALNADLDIEIWGIPANPGPSPVDPCGSWAGLPTPNPATHTGTFLRDLKVLGANDVVAVGDASVTVLGNNEHVNVAYRWNGAQWNPMSIPSPSPGPGTTACYLRCLDGTGPNDLWAAGQQNLQLSGGWTGGHLMVLHYDGTAWSVVPNVPTPPSSLSGGVSGEEVTDVDVVSTNEAWFCGSWIEYNPTTAATSRPGLLMRWTGSGFTRFLPPIVSSTGTQTFNAISASGSNDVWAVGRAFTSGMSTVPVVFQWNGSSWTHRPPPNGGLRTEIYDVEALAPNDVWVWGYTMASATGGVVYHLWHWNGSSWTDTPNGSPGRKLKVYAPNWIYVAGSAGIHRFDGTSWQVAETFVSYNFANVYEIDSLSPCDLWAVGTQSIAGTTSTFSARIDSPVYWNLSSRPPCTPAAAPGLLTAVGTPTPGTTFGVTISDPTNALASASGNAATYWFLAGGAAPSSCGIGIPVGGAGGGPGSLFFDPAALALVVGPVMATPATSGATHNVAVPLSLAGVTTHTQGALVDPANPSRFVVTNGLSVRIGY